MRALVLVVFLAACGAAPDGGADAGDVDADPAACGVWGGGAACGAGDACYWYPGVAPSGAGAGVCDADGDVAPGGDCNLNIDRATRCMPGALCWETVDFTKTCLAYCDPSAPACAPGETCQIPTASDGTVGLCSSDPL